MNHKILAVFFAFVISFGIIPAFADTTYFNDTLKDLNKVVATKNSISVFFPFFFLIAIALFMVYGLKNRDDKVSIVFTISAFLLCIVLSLMFISPLQFTSITNVTQITAEQNQLVDSIVNSTSIIQTTNENVIIPNDVQFRFLLSSFFWAFALLNGLFTILILTRWSSKGSH